MANIEPTERQRTTGPAPSFGEPAPISERRAQHERKRGFERSLKVAGGGSIVQAVCGLGAVVLAILGLAKLWPRHTMAIAILLVGVAFLAQAGAVAAEHRKLSHAFGASEADLTGGASAEAIGGAAGVVLGILTLINIAPMVLGPIAVIVFGGTLLVGGGLTATLGTVGGELADRGAEAAEHAAKAASGIDTLVGIGAVVLGVIALAGGPAATLTLIALLALGAAVLLSGSAVGGRMLSVTRH